MTAKQLTDSILQLAIQGKLVPQDPNDEPASVLLDRIREEKKRLVKEGKLKKKDLEETPINEDEIPFEIPESWEWCRIGDIFAHTSGKQQSSSNTAGKPQKFITTSNLYWGRFELEKVKTMNFTDEEVKTCSATKGDLLVCEGGAGYGRSAIWDKNYDICLQNHVHRLRPYIDGVAEYVLYNIYFLKETNRLASVGMAMPGLSANRLKALLIPLPPIDEQARIVDKIKKLAPVVEEYGIAFDEEAWLNAELPEKLKKSILQEAIMGKLGTQDPNDEPASALLDRIREEKKALVKAGVLKKKDLEETPIAEDERPFDIPDDWEWVRIGCIGEVITGGTPSKLNNDYYGNDYPFYKPGDLDKGIDISSSVDGLSKKGFEASRKLKAYSVLVTCIGATIGKTGLIKTEGACNQQINAILPSANISPRFLYYTISAPYMQRIMRKDAGKTTLPIMNKSNFSKLLIPLPPLAEQHRIVEKIEALFAEVDHIEI